MLNIPTKPEAFPTYWLNRALSPHLNGCQVTHCEASLSDIPGQTIAWV
jgi:hypothetical protein